MDRTITTYKKEPLGALFSFGYNKPTDVIDVLFNFWIYHTFFGHFPVNDAIIEHS